MRRATFILSILERLRSRTNSHWFFDERSNWFRPLFATEDLTLQVHICFYIMTTPAVHDWWWFGIYCRYYLCTFLCTEMNHIAERSTVVFQSHKIWAGNMTTTSCHPDKIFTPSRKQHMLFQNKEKEIICLMGYMSHCEIYIRELAHYTIAATAAYMPFMYSMYTYI